MLIILTTKPSETFFFKVCKSVHHRTIHRPARPRTQHDCHHDTKVKPEAATAVIEPPMMGGKTPETCWAVNKRQDNKLENCCIWLVIYLNLTNHVTLQMKTEQAEQLNPRLWWADKNCGGDGGGCGGSSEMITGDSSR